MIRAETGPETDRGRTSSIRSKWEEVALSAIAIQPPGSFEMACFWALLWNGNPNLQYVRTLGHGGSVRTHRRPI